MDTRSTENESETRRRTTPSTATRDAERKEAQAAHEPDLPSADVEPPEGDLDPAVAEHEREMLERGANQKGEGRVP